MLNFLNFRPHECNDKSCANLELHDRFPARNRRDGGGCTQYASRHRAKCGALHFTGTNSFLLGEDTIAVVDPGPDDPQHLAALIEAIGGRAVEAMILTHTHKDHSELAPKLKAATGAPLWFAGPHHLSRPLRLFEINRIANSSDWNLKPDRVLHDGESFKAAEV